MGANLLIRVFKKEPGNPWQPSGWVLKIRQETKCVITSGKRGTNPAISFGHSHAHVGRTLVLTNNTLLMMQTMHQSYKIWNWVS